MSERERGGGKGGRERRREKGIIAIQYALHPPDYILHCMPLYMSSLDKRLKSC